MRLVLWVVVLCLVAAGQGNAEGTQTQAAQPRSCRDTPETTNNASDPQTHNAPGLPLTAARLIQRTADWRTHSPLDESGKASALVEFPGPVGARGISESFIEVRLRKDQLAALPGLRRFEDLTVIGAANPLRDPPSSPNRQIMDEAKAAGARIHDATGDIVRIRLSVPRMRQENSWREEWRFAIAFCNAQSDSLMGFVSFDGEVRNASYGRYLKWVVLLACWLLVAICAYRLHRRTIEALWRQTDDAKLRPKPPLWYTVVRAINPVFATQDAAGYGSLSKFQLLVFTCAVVAVVAEAFHATGDLPNFSNTILMLLGITAAGTTLSRAVSGSSLSYVNRGWLIDKGAIETDTREPRLVDLVGIEGELDVTRVQAVAFSAFALVALMNVIPTDVASFTLPEHILFLMGLSQGVYVLGRVIPAEAIRRLNEDLDRLRQAEDDMILHGANATDQQRNAFKVAAAAAVASLRAATQGPSVRSSRQEDPWQKLRTTLATQLSAWTAKPVAPAQPAPVAS